MLEFVIKTEYELLHVAARISDVPYARQILQVYPECIHAWNNEMDLPLHLACLHGAPNMIQFLLDEETRLNVESVCTALNIRSHFTPIQLSCINPNTTVEVMKSLLHANLECEPSSMIWQQRLFHIAAMGSNTDIVRYFIDVFPQAMAITSDTGNLPIRFACRSGSAGMVELLLNEGIRTYDSLSGLLLYRENLYPETTLQLACSNPNMEGRVIKRILRRTKATFERVLEDHLLNRAARCGNLGVAEVILSFWPMTLYQKDKEWNLPLHLACYSGSSRMVRLLFTKSVKNLLMTDKHRNWNAVSESLFQKNRNGLTPWDLLCGSFSAVLDFSGDEAFTGGTWPCIKLILYLRANMLARQPSGSIPLFHAAIMIIKPLDMLTAVILSGVLQCDPCVIDHRRRTALHVAVKQQAFNKGTWKEIVEYLLDEEHNRRQCALIRDVDNRLPLHVASAFGLKWSDGMDYVLEANVAALEEKDEKTGLYPFMLAATGTASSGCESDLDTIFELLRLNPTMIGECSSMVE